MNVPLVEEYELLVPVVQKIYEHTSKLSWQMLLPLFLISVTASYTTDLGLTGAILLRLKRLVLVAILLVSFPTIAEFSQSLGIEVAQSIDDMSGIDMILDAAAKKSESYSFDIQSLLNFYNDVIMGALILCTFLLLCVARYFLLAFQHFYWFLLVALGPFLILCSLFEAASGITRNLFKNMFQVAAWPVIWSILSAFLKALPFNNVYAIEGNQVSVIVLNIIIAVALLFSPFIVSQLTDGSTLSVGDTLRKGALKTVSTMKTFGASSVAGKGFSAAAKTARFTKGKQ
jgi:hypothetical protein